MLFQVIRNLPILNFLFIQIMDRSRDQTSELLKIIYERYAKKN
jgi:hypothetical protein